jgi:hypothetical protein
MVKQDIETLFERAKMKPKTIKATDRTAVYFANLTGPILEMAGLEPDPRITDCKPLVALLATLPGTAFEAIDIEISDWYETEDGGHGTWSFTATLTPHGVGDVCRPRIIQVRGRWHNVDDPPFVRETIDTATIA